MKRYTFINNLTGWFIFLIAAITYLLTIEPTTSFWDCGEFIASAYKLQVGHPPGAPFFMLLARIFSLFALGDVTSVAMMINAMSGLASAFTVLFLFWTITHLAKKIILTSEEQIIFNQNINIETYPVSKLIAIIGSGVVGALAFAFSDTFWFSAVEGEVYASSSLFTAVVFWAILKWENVADQHHANRWLIFIAYLMGLSIGVHLLNLLAIPAIVLVYYFRKYQITTKGIVYASLIAVIALASIMYGVIPGVVSVASVFELAAVNGFGMPFNSGLFIYCLVLLAVIAGGLFFSYKSKQPIYATLLTTTAITLMGIPFVAGYESAGKILIGILCIVIIGVVFYKIAKNNIALLNTILLVYTVIILGYSSFALIVIRSHANPPMDENNPEHVFALLSYLNREQYGDRPLAYGAYYNAPIVERKDGKNIYTPINGRYEVTDKKVEYEYDPRFKTLFPRMYSSQGSHVNAYKSWATVEGKSIEVQTGSGKTETRQCPTFFDNIEFFVKYQIGHMYLRYFMWNFVGRQNDKQGHGDYLKGNWLSGLPFVDSFRLGTQQNLPQHFKDNKSRNRYFMLPLLLGIIGMIFLYNRNINFFWVILVFFIFTGFAIIVYLNQTPYQPRERDYGYTGSFYVFTIWIGLGILGIYQFFKKVFLFPGKLSAWLANILALIAVPALMAIQNWDDHDRSGRYTARDFAYNYLNSCAPNAILFTYGDNDTFPLWYAQEVEGIRTDVRVVNLSLLGTDWYINQMKRKAYESEPVPFSMVYEKYIQGKRDFVPVREDPKFFLEDKYQANKNVLDTTYRKIYANFMETITKTKFPELHSKDFEKLQQGYQSLSPLRFYSLITNLSKAEKSKYELPSYFNDSIIVPTEDFITEIATSYLPVEKALEFIASDDPQTKLSGYSKPLDYMPSRKLKVKVDKQKVLKNGTVPPHKADQILPYLEWDVPKSYLGKNDMMIVDLLATNNWERPVYFAISMGNDSYLNLNKYFQLEGFAYRLVPYKAEDESFEHTGTINSDILYDNLMNKFKWGRMNAPDVYIDEQNKRTLSIMNSKSVFAQLANQLSLENKQDSAVAVLNRCLELMPHEKIPYDYHVLELIDAYYNANATEKANALAKKLAKVYFDEIRYFTGLDGRFLNAVDRELSLAVQVIDNIVKYAQNNNQTEVSEELQNTLNMFIGAPQKKPINE